MKKKGMLNKMQKKGVAETGVLAGIIIVVFTLMLLATQSAIGHTPWILPSALPLLAITIIFVFVEKIRPEHNEKSVH